jgi:serine/threonine protein kinase
MELCEGGELMEQLEHMGTYSEADAANIVALMADVLTYLHGHGIVHRDIKPENLLLVDRDDHATVKMADFGLANVMEGSGHYDVKAGVHEVACGTPAYMAPEVYLDAKAALNPKVDMWSLGVMVYMLLCGQVRVQNACWFCEQCASPEPACSVW